MVQIAVAISILPIILLGAGALLLAARSSGDEDGPPVAPTDLEALQAELNARGVTDFTANELTWSGRLNENLIPPPDLMPNLLNVAQLAQRIRTEYGKPLVVTSAYRPEPMNTQVGGIPNSQHVRAAALDLTMPSGTATPEEIDRLRMIAARMWIQDPSFHGLGMYDSPPGRIHVDVEHPGSTGRETWPVDRVAPYLVRAEA